MTTFSFSTGNPTNLTGGSSASMTDLSGSFADLKTFLNGASLDSTNIAALGVNTAQIAANAVTAAKIEAQQAWQTIAMTNFGTNLSYYKDSLGIVHFRGDENTTTGAIASVQLLCTLPVGYRPGSTQYIPGVSLTTLSPGNVYVVTVQSNGNVASSGAASWSAGAGAKFTFGGVHFRAEN